MFALAIQTQLMAKQNQKLQSPLPVEMQIKMRSLKNLIRLTKMAKDTAQSWKRMWGNRSSHILLVGV